MGLAAIIAAGEAPAAVVRSMIAGRQMVINDGGGGLSAKSYVQDGLVTMWDGIENAGWGQHDPNATVWKDLVGDVDFNLTSAGTFSSNHLYCSGSAVAATATPQFNPSFAESVIYCEDTFSNMTSEEIAIRFSGQGGRVQKEIGFCPRYNSGIIIGRVSPVVYNFADINKTNQYSINYANNSLIVNGSYVESKTDYTGTMPGYNHAVMGIGANDQSNQYRFRGGVYCVRLYSRALTADEIAANYAVDVARFNLP